MTPFDWLLVAVLSPFVVWAVLKACGVDMLSLLPTPVIGEDTGSGEGGGSDGGD